MDEDIAQYNSQRQNCRNNLAGKAITNIINMGGTEGTVDHETCC